MFKKQLFIMLVFLIKNTTGMEKFTPSSLGNLNKYEELHNQKNELQFLANENNKLKSIMAQINNDEGYTPEVSPFLDKLQRKAAKQKDRERLKQLVDLQQSQMQNLQHIRNASRNAALAIELERAKKQEEELQALDQSWQELVAQKEAAKSQWQEQWKKRNQEYRNNDQQWKEIATQKEIACWDLREECSKKHTELIEKDEKWKKACAEKHEEWLKYCEHLRVQEQKNIVAARDTAVSEWQKKDEQWKKACAETHQEWTKFVAEKDALVAQQVKRSQEMDNLLVDIDAKIGIRHYLKQGHKFFDNDNPMKPLVDYLERNQIPEQKCPNYEINTDSNTTSNPIALTILGAVYGDNWQEKWKANQKPK